MTIQTLLATNISFKDTIYITVQTLYCTTNMTNTTYYKYKNEMKGIGMVNQQKGVQQETAYSAVVVNVSPFLPISFFHASAPIGI